MDNTKNFILDGLCRFSLNNLKGRPYDSAFELLAAPPSRKKLVIMGFNGSSADQTKTNTESVLDDYEKPDISNIKLGTLGNWGITRLAKRLQNIPSKFNYKWEDVIYTNALLMCSKDMSSLKKETFDAGIPIENLIRNSMHFFNEVTFSLCEPEMIIAYGNSLNGLSTASLLLKHFGDINSLRYSQNTGYYTTFSFMATFNNIKIPIVCVRHMSRFAPNDSLMKDALSLICQPNYVS
ncbi:hypothetical protein D0Z62_06305 [Providencia rettgeri]|uniref:hypothetical protein n=1 Tax=Morganellaceae TaxID=1903414 RepID=UPI000D6985E8|nr:MULTISPECIES: hypothetical protein [Morganellaceae]RXN73424.1 hypothetical protein D0Z62_06305 [Providencia rettgeri]